MVKMTIKKINKNVILSNILIKIRINCKICIVMHFIWVKPKGVFVNIFILKTKKVLCKIYNKSQERKYE